MLTFDTFYLLKMFTIWRLASTIIAIFGVIILADFVSGMVHWSVDTHGNIDVPIFGKVLTFSKDVFDFGKV